MAFKYILYLIVVAIILPGCSEKCQVTCQIGLQPAAIGYPFGELDTVIVITHSTGGSFINSLFSDTLTKYFYPDIPSWTNINNSSGNDTVGDTLTDNNSNRTYEEDAPYEIQIIVPSNNNAVYTYTNIILMGDQVQNQLCKEGTPTPGNCGRYIASYVLNGNKVTFNGNPGYLYFQK